MTVKEPIEKKIVTAALEEVCGILKAEGVVRFASMAYVKRDLPTRATLSFDFDSRRWLFDCSLLAMLSVSTRMRRALQRAAAEAFESEVVDTEMLDLIIGEGKDFSSREEWIENRLDSWFMKN
jgi:hypothetical protein